MDITSEPRFDERYQEIHTLRDGRRVRLRMIRPTDQRRLLAGFDRLSEVARRARFLGPRKRLSAAELKYLTDLDGIDHFALGVVELNARAEEGDGVAIARFRRDPADASAAEPAIVVLDDWQRSGLGCLLMERLAAAARERGIRTFRGEFLAENLAIRKLLESLCPELSIRIAEPGVYALEMPLESVGRRR